VVCTDWMLLNDVKYLGRTIVDAKCWGVEDLSVEQRVHKVIQAGVDQFGGESCVDVLLQLVKNGQISESRIDQSVRRLLRDKFRLGLFDNPYVDVDSVEKVVGKEGFLRAGALAQRKSIVLLKNSVNQSGKCLPLTGKPKLFIENIDRAVAEQYATIVQTVEEADFAILRLNAPFVPRKGFLERMFHAGDLDFKNPEKERLLSILTKVPTIVDIYCDRPPVIPEIVDKCAALLADFGAEDEAVLDIIFGKFAPCGKLPVEFPSSMEAVRAQKEDVPYDSENPCFPFGFGLGYE
jgi:beta-glucosidase